MRSDDELLGHIREQTGIRRRRRQRAVAGSATAAVVLLLGIGALAGRSGDDGSEPVNASDDGSTTLPVTTAPPSTTEDATTTSTTSTTVPDETTTTEAPTTTTETPTTTSPPTTTTPPIPDVVETTTSDGLTLTATLHREADRPSQVRIVIRVQAARGSAPFGDVDIDDDGLTDTFGPFPVDYGKQECWPDTNPDLPPDADAGPVDATFTMEGEIDLAFDSRIPVTAQVSYCTADAAFATVELFVPKG